MRLASRQAGLVFALSLPTLAIAQADGEVPTPVVHHQSDDLRLHLKYGTFDPLLGSPMVAEALLAGVDTNLYIVQYPFAFTDAERQALRAAGATLLQALPQNAIVVRMTAATAAAVATLPDVRWVGAYQPAYRLEAELLTEIAKGQVPTRRYNLVMVDKRNDKAALQAKLAGIGARNLEVLNDSILFRADMTGAQLLQAARFDEVLWIDRWTPETTDMDNARIVQGSNYIETIAGYRGDGIRGHVYEGVEYNHPDFTTPFTLVDTSNVADDHGHCTAGCIFGNGTSDSHARGHAPNAVGFFTNYNNVTGGLSRNQVINDVVNTYNCMFTTASWGNAQTTQYTSISADADDIVFDHRIPWTQSMSNLGNQNARPQAWGKNIISIGGMYHYNDSNPANDSWGNGGSTGPAADTRIKPDLSNFYDQVWTSDRSGAAGYSAGNSFSGFNGTSSATPITAGTNALLIQMYTDQLFGNTERVHGGSRFQNRPYAQTVKAIQIACATQYALSQGTRYQQGWGYPNLRTIYDNRAKMFIVPEDKPITQGTTHTYEIQVAAGEPSLKVCMTYLDPMGNVAAAIDRINDLTLRVIHPNGSTAYWGNAGLVANTVSSTGGSANTVDTVECVFVNSPASGVWTIEVTAPTIAQDGYVATAATDAVYALAVNGGIRTYTGCARFIPDADPTTGGANVIPLGTTPAETLTTLFATNNGGSVGGAVYFDITPSSDFYWEGLDVNTSVTVGSNITVDVYTRSGTFAGNEANAAAWLSRTAGHGIAAAQDSPSRINFNNPLYTPGGSTTGVCLVARDFNHKYTNGSNTYTNSDMTITTGSASNVPFTGTITGRTANLNIVYNSDTNTWHNQFYQTILRRDDLGPAGTITGLAFAPIATGRHMNRLFTIRMSQVPMGHSLSTTFSSNMPSPVTVLSKVDYSWDLTADTWTEVGLTSGFAYDGAHDVVVEILARANFATSTGSFDAFHSGSNERVYAYGWPFTAQPSTGTYGSSSGLKMRANFNCAEAGSFGTACGYVRAVPFGASTAPGSFWYDIYGVPNNGAIIIMGFQSQSLSLTPYGLTNCVQWTDNVASTFHAGTASGHFWHYVSIPATTAFDGLILYGQWFQLDNTQPGGLSASNYVRAIIGQLLP